MNSVRKQRNKHLRHNNSESALNGRLANGVNRGITIFEFLFGGLLVVGIAFSGIMLWKIGAQQVRDNTRLAEITKLEQTLAVYYKQQRHYPIALAQTALTGDDVVSYDIEHEVATIEIFPDPLYPEFQYKYQSDISGTTYSLRFCLERITTERFSPGCNNTVRP